MTMRVPRPQACALVLATLLVAGCGESSIDEQTVGEDIQMFVHRRLPIENGGQDALVEGTLTVANGCVLLEQDGIRYPVVWPVGTKVAQDEPLAIELPSGEVLDVGETVSGGGGYHDATFLGLSIAEACLNEHGEVARFNQREDQTIFGD